VVHPASAVALEAACAMIGSGIGGGVGSRTFQFEFTREADGKMGVKIQPA